MIRSVDLMNLFKSIKNSFAQYAANNNYNCCGFLLTDHITFIWNYDVRFGKVFFGKKRIFSKKRSLRSGIILQPQVRF